MSNTAQPLEKVLIDKGIITQQQYDLIKNEQMKSEKTFEQVIVDTNIVTQDNLLKIKADQSGLSFTDPTQENVKPETIALISESMARKYKIIPIKSDAKTITVAMIDTNDLEVIDFIERSTKLKVIPTVSTENLILSSIDKEYSKSLGKDVSEAIEQAAASTTTTVKESLDNIDQAEEIIKVSPVAQIVSVLLEYAVKSNASDIHIEPFESGTRIRYRIDGILQEKFPLPKTIHSSVVARIKILANMQIDEHRKPLDGRFKLIFRDKNIDLRVSTLPTVFGEKVVIRLLKDQSNIFTFKELGLWGKALQDFETALKETNGIILVTGPTGSGKTVTNATALSKLNKVGVNIVTVEDPVEIHIDGVNQTQINTKAGLTFAAGLRSILRQDPNIIMIGEIRDGETAQLAIQAALTGHLVLATLHTNSAAGAIPRLIDMDVENFLLASTLDISVAQRLVRRACKYCKESYDPDDSVKVGIVKVLGERLLRIGLGASPFDSHEDVVEQKFPPKDEVKKQETKSEVNLEVKSGPAEKVLPLANSKDTSQDQKPENGEEIKALMKGIRLVRAKGCDKCNNSGYKGRIALYEVMKVDDKIQELTLRKSSSDEIQRQAEKNGLINLLQDGYLKALWGITTFEEVLTATDE